MKNRYTRLATVLALSAGAALASTASQAQEVMARVLSSTAVMQQVAVPRQVCSNQQVIQQVQPSGAGAAMGAIAGGAVGNAIGGGTGRDIATVIGLVGGAIIGNRVEGTRDEVRNVQQCTTQTSYENRILHYDVIYEYEGKRYSIKMPNDPGQYVRLQLSPVGVLPAPSSSAPSSSIFTPISSAEPTTTNVTVVQAAPIYVAAAPVVYPAVRYAYPSYAAPISLSVGWYGGGYRHGGHGHGHGHRGGHWR